jgi:hypothetical protein
MSRPSFSLSVLFVIIIGFLVVKTQRLSTELDKANYEVEKWFTYYLGSTKKMVECHVQLQDSENKIVRLLEINQELQTFKREHQCIKMITD